MSAATRARLAASALCLVWPMMTSSTDAGSTPARSTAAVMTIFAISSGWTLLIDPPTLPRAVRTAETMTTSFMDSHPSQTNDIVPPSTYRTVPVMKSEAAEARKTDGPTRSSMSAMRPIGTLSSMRS